MKATRFGDPLADESVDYGPLINQAGFRKVDTLVRGAVAAGATITTGGGRGPGEGGYFYQPTVVTGCRQEMEIIRREIFGPVIPVVTFHDLDEAIACAKRFRLWADLLHLHARPERRPQGLPRDPFRRDLYQPRELRSHAGLPRRLAQERHRRRGRQTRPVRVLADAYCLHRTALVPILFTYDAPRWGRRSVCVVCRPVQSWQTTENDGLPHKVNSIGVSPHFSHSASRCGAGTPAAAWASLFLRGSSGRTNRQVLPGTVAGRSYTRR